MRNLAFIFVTLLILVGVQVQAAKPCSDVYCPYHFGTTPLRCIKGKSRKKRSDAPSRSTIVISHRYLTYRGYYFEFGGGSGGGSATVKTYRMGSHCSSDLESRPAGWSMVSLDCMRKCASQYTHSYGKYQWFHNNCHDFANRMAEVLYDYRNSVCCPKWCEQ